MEEIDSIINSLSPNERAILPYLSLKDTEKISKSAGLDETSVKRAIDFLANKGILKTEIKSKKIISLGNNGILYLKNELPERRLLNALSNEKSKKLTLKGAKEKAHLSDNELSIALGCLKGKALVNLKQDEIMLNAKESEISKKFLEEKFLEFLPLNAEELSDEQKYSLESLKKRRDIIKIEEKTSVSYEIFPLGKKLLDNLDKVKESSDLIEALTPELMRNNGWKGKKFRHYDLTSKVPHVYGGKRHFVNQAIDYGRKIWTEMGFEEMSGTLTQTGFWNFDALFTAQDHPVREIHDTFYIKGVKGKLPKIADAVKKAHENGVAGSKGWGYKWEEEESKKVVLRTHTTALSAHMLAKLKENGLKNLPAKFFAVGKCFRNDTLDWKHGFEFNQTEGIVIDENANFRNLIGYLKEFAKKMGYEKVRFRPHYFPYTEPSLEGDVWNEERKEWMEVFAAGIFRPEVTAPLLGKPIPVLAWGPGFDRMVMMLYNLQDLREMYKNDLNQLRKIKFWPK